MNKKAIGRLGAVAIVLVTAMVGALLGSVGARGVTSDASVWGTFAHIATGDITSSDAKQGVTQRYDMIALRGNLTTGLLADLHGRRAGVVLLAYEKAAGLNNAEVASIKNELGHPEWIARDATNNEIHPQNIDNTTLGDLTNAGFRQWQADKIAAEVGLGADGAFVDTLGAYFSDNFYSGRPVVNGVAITDAAWRDGSSDLLTRIKNATGKMVVANGFGLQNGKNYAEHQFDADQLINAADGVQIEAFTRSGNTAPTQYAPAAQWDQDLAFLDAIGARGKVALAYTKVKVAATSAQLNALRDYALASFLLACAPGRSYFGFDDGAAIPAVASDTTAARNLGLPVGARTRSAVDEWTRPFGGGRVTVKAGNAPVFTTGPVRSVATFTGSGTSRVSFPLTVGTGPVVATLTWSGGSTRTLMIFQNSAMVAGPVTAASPVVINTSLTAGSYVFSVQGQTAAAFTLNIEYTPPGGAGTTVPTGTTTTTTVGSTTTTSTTRPPTTTTAAPTTTTAAPTTTTRAPTTTTSTTAPGRKATTFSGSGGQRSSYQLTIGSGPVTATLTFADGGYRRLTIWNGSTIVGGPATTGSPVVINATLPAGSYTFTVDGPSTGSYTLRVQHSV